MNYVVGSNLDDIVERLFSRDEYNKEEVLRDGVAIFSQLLAYLYTSKHGMPDSPDMAWNLESFRFMHNDPSKVEEAIAQLDSNLGDVFPGIDVSVSHVVRELSGSPIVDIIIVIGTTYVATIDTSKLTKSFDKWISLKSI